MNLLTLQQTLQDNRDLLLNYVNENAGAASSFYVNYLTSLAATPKFGRPLDKESMLNEENLQFRNQQLAAAFENIQPFCKPRGKYDEASLVALKEAIASSPQSKQIQDQFSRLTTWLEQHPVLKNNPAKLVELRAAAQESKAYLGQYFVFSLQSTFANHLRTTKQVNVNVGDEILLTGKVLYPRQETDWATSVNLGNNILKDLFQREPKEFDAFLRDKINQLKQRADFVLLPKEKQNEQLNKLYDQLQNPHFLEKENDVKNVFMKNREVIKTSLAAIRQENSKPELAAQIRKQREDLRMEIKQLQAEVKSLQREIKANKMTDEGVRKMLKVVSAIKETHAPYLTTDKYAGYGLTAAQKRLLESGNIMESPTVKFHIEKTSALTEAKAAIKRNQAELKTLKVPSNLPNLIKKTAFQAAKFFLFGPQLAAKRDKTAVSSTKPTNNIKPGNR